MPADVRVCSGSAHDVPAVARLHREQLSDSFLASLGERFLGVLYHRIVREPNSTLLVARGSGRVVGFIAGTQDTGQLYRTFVRHDGVRALAAAAPALLRHPRTTLETLRYGGESGSDAELPTAELLSIAVDPSVRREGIGARLIGALLEDFSGLGVSGARVTVAADNTAAIAAYRRCGFRRGTRVEVHRGRTSEVLVWG